MGIFLQRKYLNTLLIFCSLGLFYFGYIFYKQTENLINVNQEVKHTYQVISIANVILYDLSRAESKQRAYLLTNNPNYKRDYLIYNQSIYFKLDILRSLTKDNPPQQSNIEQLQNLLNEHTASLQKLTESFEREGLSGAIKKTGIEREEFDKALDMAGNIINEEKNLLITRNKTALENSVRTISMVIIGDAIGISLILACIVLLNYQLIIRIRTEKKLTKLAYYSVLTKLPNRLLFLKQLKELIENQKKHNHFISIFVLNLDNFKNINHLFGFETGNSILKSIARRLKNNLANEVLLAHPEGNEFIIALSHSGEFDTTDYAKKLQEIVSRKINFNKQEIQIGASIGISIFPSNGNNAEILIKNATIAMYRAKESGRNTYQYSNVAITAEVEERALLGYYLQQAIDRKEFLLLYQPKINLKEGGISGFEALMRWRRPDGNIIYPASFISLAENNGLIGTIGKWMLSTACQQLKTWQTNRVPIKNLAINISPIQLEASDFIDMVKKVIKETEVDPTLLEFEITENILIKKTSETISTLQELKKLGVKITIDDFGTGFSSLSYFKLFSVDKVKIDQSFVKEIRFANQDSIIISAIILIAHHLNIKVVAEGVETKVQETLLKQYHCDEAQGFLYSPALSSEEVIRFCERGQV